MNNQNNGVFDALGVQQSTQVTHADGHTTVSKTPKVTSKGQVYARQDQQSVFLQTARAECIGGML